MFPFMPNPKHNYAKLFPVCRSCILVSALVAPGMSFCPECNECAKKVFVYVSRLANRLSGAAGAVAQVVVAVQAEQL